MKGVNMIAKRILQARKAAGLSMQTVAKKAGISTMAISKYERGLMKPSSAVLLALAKALNVKVEYFFRSVSVDLKAIEYRKHSKLPATIQARIEGDAIDQVERFFELKSLLPQLPVQPFRLPKTLPQHVTNYDDIENFALMVRKAWKLGENPIPNLIDTLEEHGILVLCVHLETDQKFDGLSAKADNVPVIVIGKGDDWPGDRQRFTLAHEMGHFILKGRIASDLDEEKAANRFAGAFLAPKNEVVSLLGHHRSWLEPKELWYLKREYGLSMNAWLYRALDLGVINQLTYKKLNQYFHKRGWHKKEPFTPYPCEEPMLFNQLVFRALGQALVSESKAAELLRMPLVEFRRFREADGVETTAGQ